MFVFGNLLQAIASVLDFLLTAYMYIVIISAVLSWVNPDPYNPIVRFLYGATEPVFRVIRRKLPMNMGIDFSPLIVIAAIYFTKIFVVKTLMDFSYRMH